MTKFQRAEDLRELETSYLPAPVGIVLVLAAVDIFAAIVSVVGG